MKTVAFTASHGDEDFYIRRRYIEYLTRFCPGVLPVILPTVTDECIIREYARLFDGFIFTGGDDIDPALYGEEKEKACGVIHRLRDEFELALLREVMRLDKPVLGICRGMQVINVSLGGTLLQDIGSAGFDSHTAETNGPPTHEVQLSGKLRNIIGAERILTNSYHHQSVRRLGHGLSAVAYSSDGLAEGIWHHRLRFLCGVQWHPEMSADGYSARLIQAFALQL